MGQGEEQNRASLAAGPCFVNVVLSTKRLSDRGPVPEDRLPGLLGRTTRLLTLLLGGLLRGAALLGLAGFRGHLTAPFPGSFSHIARASGRNKPGSCRFCDDMAKTCDIGNRSLITFRFS